MSIKWHSHIGELVPDTRIFPLLPPDSIGTIHQAWSTLKRQQSSGNWWLRTAWSSAKAFGFSLGILSPILLALAFCELNGFETPKLAWTVLISLPCAIGLVVAWASYPYFSYSFIGEKGWAFLESAGSPKRIIRCDVVVFDEVRDLFFRVALRPPKRLLGERIQETSLHSCWVGESGEKIAEIRDDGTDLKMLAHAFRGTLRSIPGVRDFFELKSRDEQNDVYWNEDGINKPSLILHTIAEWGKRHREHTLKDLKGGHKVHFRLLDSFPGTSEEQTLGEQVGGDSNLIESVLERRSGSLNINGITISPHRIDLHTATGSITIEPCEVSGLTLDLLCFSIELSLAKALVLPDTGKEVVRVLKYADAVPNLSSLIASLQHACQCPFDDRRPNEVQAIVAMKQ